MMSLISAIFLAGLVLASASPVRNRQSGATERGTSRAQTTFQSYATEPLRDYLKSITWWSLASLRSDVFNTSDPDYTARDFKQSKALFTQTQQRMLIRGLHFDPLVYAVASAALTTRTYCQALMQHDRWACTDSGILQRGKNLTIPYYGQLVEYTTRQTAFLTALSSAALMTAVMNACTQNRTDIPCGCDPRFRVGHIAPSQLPMEYVAAAPYASFEWGDCSDNAEFAKAFVNEFMGWPLPGNDARFLANKHNRELGMRVVEDHISTQCRCVGANCRSKAVCFRRAQQFSKISESLKALYENAKRTIPTPYHRNRGSLLHRSGEREPDTNDLVYTDETRDEDFCDANAKFGTPGTQNRTCDPDRRLQASNDKRSCRYLCCGRGFAAKEATRMSQGQILVAPNNEIVLIPGKLEKYTLYQCL